LLILAGEVVFADRPADVLESFERLAVGVQGLALPTLEASTRSSSCSRCMMMTIAPCRLSLSRL
jgi:hypothetical protein